MIRAPFCSATPRLGSEMNAASMRPLASATAVSVNGSSRNFTESGLTPLASSHASTAIEVMLLSAFTATIFPTRSEALVIGEFLATISSEVGTLLE